MLHHLSSRAATTVDGDVVAMLAACHVRIRGFLAMARRIAGDEDGAGVAEAAEAVRRYFAIALPLHVADEDELIAPRLRGGDAMIEGLLDDMHAEHVGHEAAVAALIALVTALAADPARRDALRGELAAATEALEAILEPHMVREEAALFPAIARLSADEQVAIVAAMRARRS